MKKYNTSPLSGMQELLPTEQAVFDQLKQNISDVYHHYGFLNIETPFIERADILLAKAGGDTEKQIYMVSKTAESADSADQALRFDHTVPLARYVVEHNNDLAFPFQVTQINRNFRGERAQRGRFREFYQCDCDIIGREKLPIAYDAKVIACIYDALATFNLPKMLIRISNRKVLAGFLATIGAETQSGEIANIIDHAEKVPQEKSEAALRELGLSEETVTKIVAFMFTKGDYGTIEAKLTEILSGKLENVREGLDELKQVFNILSAKPEMADKVTIDLMIIRGLDYYTGTVFETFLQDYREIGSISSGGRYENLASNFTEQKFPGVGGSIGLTRLFFVLNEYKLLAKEQAESVPLDYCILPISENEIPFAMTVAAALRAENSKVDIDFDTRKFGARLNRAAKLARFAIVIGDQESASREVEIKNLTTGEKSKRQF
ncbi:histidine--tRNA ligase [Candidatus Saccharibacteria bacterium]|nr:histidine--tRNA ligase [Candidatus Saccharibacteria bacterium]